MLTQRLQTRSVSQVAVVTQTVARALTPHAGAVSLVPARRSVSGLRASQIGRAGCKLASTNLPQKLCEFPPVNVNGNSRARSLFGANLVSPKFRSKGEGNTGQVFDDARGGARCLSSSLPRSVVVGNTRNNTLRLNVAVGHESRGGFAAAFPLRCGCHPRTRHGSHCLFRPW